MKTEPSEIKSTCDTEEIQQEFSEVSESIFKDRKLLCSLRIPEVPLCSTPISNGLLNRLSTMRQQLNRMESDLIRIVDDGFPEEPSAQIVRLFLPKFLSVIRL